MKNCMSPCQMKMLSMLCFILGFASVLGLIFIWYYVQGDDRAHAERFGIFVGLWAPTFFALSTRLHVFADSCCDKESCSKKVIIKRSFRLF
jgi:hypothetical protein